MKRVLTSAIALLVVLALPASAQVPQPKRAQVQADLANLLNQEVELKDHTKKIDARDRDETERNAALAKDIAAYDAEVYGYDSSEIVGTVAMPAPLIELLEAFVAEHHVEEPFVKRQRQKHHRAEEHKFGQEPIAELRQRKGQPGASENE